MHQYGIPPSYDFVRNTGSVPSSLGLLILCSLVGGLFYRWHCTCILWALLPFHQLACDVRASACFLQSKEGYDCPVPAVITDYNLTWVPSQTLGISAARKHSISGKQARIYSTIVANCLFGQVAFSVADEGWDAVVTALRFADFGCGVCENTFGLIPLQFSCY